MKSTGIVRRLDALNRVVIPKEIARIYGLEGESVEIYVDEDKIILKKYNPACVFCGEAADIRHFKGKNVCRECVGLMGQIALNKEVV